MSETHDDLQDQVSLPYQNAFDALKQSLISAPILSFPDFTLPFELYVDASLDGLGMTLGQIQHGK